MKKNYSDNPILYRAQCKKCLSFLSNPFEYDYNQDKEDQEIKVERYKGDNINYHAENNFSNKGKIMYSFIYCLKCQEKVGYWLSQASIKEKENINYIFFFSKCINMIIYEKNNVSEEQDRKFKQEEIFYQSNYLSKELIEYAKEHIDNFIKNVEKFEAERHEAELCYKSFDRRIITLKKFFILSVKERKKSFSLGIDFSKEEISSAKKRNKTWNNKNEKENENKDDENIYDTKSNGKKNNNIINDDKKDNLNEEDNENGGEIIRSNKNPGSDIYLEKKTKMNNKELSFNSKNNNKEPSLNIKNNNKKNNKNKRKRK